ncbi:MaoC family dehydratase [Verticiella sediminum]|uniref:MaoC family dehydratase n=1 Tax=Verticiella sediminum TaxID=1247510 RepID=A0A556AIJ2_9BURK|nr:MaoC family dehydratase N-terminal domain-containing protein [Verticiella sediminum]TSH92685.1 MaoC family dehydratase [Verticiella sediminum]
MLSPHSNLHDAVARLAGKKGVLLDALGSATADAVTVRRLREALGLPADPSLGVPMMAIAHLFRADADVGCDVRPHETIDASLRDPVNGGTEVKFSRPLRLGETISAERTLADAFVREGKSGPLAIIVTQTRYRDAQQEEVACVRSTMVYRGAAS